MIQIALTGLFLVIAAVTLWYQRRHWPAIKDAHYVVAMVESAAAEGGPSLSFMHEHIHRYMMVRRDWLLAGWVTALAVDLLAISLGTPGFWKWVAYVTWCSCCFSFGMWVRWLFRDSRCPQHARSRSGQQAPGPGAGSP